MIITLYKFKNPSHKDGFQKYSIMGKGGLISRPKLESESLQHY